MDKKCLNCGVDSSQVILIPCMFKEDSLYVCVKCLPGLIHGGH